MNEVPLPSGVAVETGIRSFESIQEKFSSSPYGPSLAGIIRYDRYRSLLASKEEWGDWLGADVNGLKHGHLTYMLTRSFLTDCAQPPSCWGKKVPSEAQFSFEEQEILLLAGLCHDWGEAISGDVSYALKTTADKEAELKAQAEIIGKLFLNDQSQIFLAKLNQAFEITNNCDSKLGRAFNAIERLGYLRTGLLAQKRGKRAETEGKIELSQNLQWLAVDVLINQTPALLKYAAFYPPVLKYLTDMRSLISAAFKEAADSAFENYGEEKESKKARLEEAKEGWFEFIA
jgi:hypothetical protein